MNNYSLLTIAALIAAVCVLLIHPLLVKVANRIGLVDNPNARRLNTTPIPVMGGAGVLFAVSMAIGILSNFIDAAPLCLLFAVLIAMFYTGLLDDIVSLRPSRKFMMQIIAVCLLMFVGGYRIDNLHGLWGVYTIPLWIAYPLTMLTCVGIINAINMIDGVDGLSSGYGIMVTLICSILFVHLGNTTFAVISASFMGALLPFFMHNLFGKKNKMFIGDEGTLVVGTLFSIFIVRIMQYRSPEEVLGSDPVGFLLAMFLVPVFDTLRVMISRMAAGRSPFSPDKTHLHHMFIGLGFSHAATTTTIVLINILALAVWYVTKLLHAPSEIQLYIICLIGAVFTWGPWFTVSYIEKHDPELYRRIRTAVYKYLPRRDRFFLRIQRALDKL